MSIILAIETSQRVGGVALRDSAGPVHVEMLRHASGRHDDDLMPAIDRLFKRAQLEPANLSTGAIGVSIGPGGFTGLRISISTAKMLAEVTGAKVLAVPSALVAVESILGSAIQVDATPQDVLVTLAAKGESTWCTRVRRESTMWRIDGDPGLRDAQTIDLHHVQALLADEHLPPLIRAMCERTGVAILQPAFHPAACLAIAAQMLGRGETINVLELLPLYPRPPEAVSLWDAREQRDDSKRSRGS